MRIMLFSKDAPSLVAAMINKNIPFKGPNVGFWPFDFGQDLHHKLWNDHARWEEYPEIAAQEFVRMGEELYRLQEAIPLEQDVNVDVKAALYAQEAWSKDIRERIHHLEARLGQVDTETLDIVKKRALIYKQPNFPYKPSLPDTPALCETYSIKALLAAEHYTTRLRGGPSQPFVILSRAEIIDAHQLQAGRNGHVYTTNIGLLHATRRASQCLYSPPEPASLAGTILPNVSHAAINLFVEVLNTDQPDQPRAMYLGMYVAHRSDTSMSVEAWHALSHEVKEAAMFMFFDELRKFYPQVRPAQPQHLQTLFDSGVSRVPRIEFTHVGYQDHLLKAYVF